MKLLVIGASRGIGACVVEAALARGHEVRALSRSAADMPLRDGLEPLPGDATDPEAVAEAVQGVDAVVMALGVPEGLSMLWTEVTLFSEATGALLPAMQQAGVRRLVAVTGIGAGDSASALSTAERMTQKALLGRPYADKDRQEEMIRASGLDWTLLRPGILTNGAVGRYKVLREPGEWRMGLISRRAVADAVMQTLEDETSIGTAPVLVR
ncbi:NAD(P)-dependent oxidoreductase [Salipiger mucosus]|uniref:Flavin reductase n=1 Tax=Salipiger mucosus DSM 16094 TaxID=1123237 RepID=S9QVG0_9RHOB|nr:NAD(P)-binding oxidoreductase [Salipiger mucosus]EPX85411.1 Flavin reductase [Salipiger mucosus DSM 16094]